MYQGFCIFCWHARVIFMLLNNLVDEGTRKTLTPAEGINQVYLDVTLKLLV